MKKYSNYKIINDVWIDAVPEHWEVNSLKYFVEIINGYAFKSEDYSDDEGVPIIRIGDISYPVDVSNAKKATPKNLNELDRFIIKKGDLLLAMTGATIGKNCLYDSNEIAYVNQRVGLLRSKNVLAQNFLKYYIDTPLFREFISLTCFGSAQENISASQISGIKFPLPSIAEQLQIARYLDHQTSLIDEIINRKEKQIELLKEKRQAIINETVTKGLNPDAKMKDSGIEWLGEIPEHWLIKKAKYLLNEENGIKIGPFGSALKLDTLVESGIKIYGQGNVIKDDFTLGDRFLSEERFENEFKQYEIFEGDVLVTMMGTTGKSKIFKKEYKRGILDSHLLRLRFNESVFSGNLFSVILEQSDYISQQVIFMSRGAIMAGLNSTIIKELNILVPPLDEQNELMKFISLKSQQMDLVIYKVEAAIIKLKEYRQSIISEAVTGKIDVRDWQPNNSSN